MYCSWQKVERIVLRSIISIWAQLSWDHYRASGSWYTARWWVSKILRGERGCLLYCIGIHCCEVCNNDWTGRDTVWVVGGPKVACIGWWYTLMRPDEYDLTVHVRRWCGLLVKLLWPLVWRGVVISSEMCSRCICCEWLDMLAQVQVKD